jgi:hypothetical protein
MKQPVSERIWAPQVGVEALSKPCRPVGETCQAAALGDGSAIKRRDQDIIQTGWDFLLRCRRSATMISPATKFCAARYVEIGWIPDAAERRLR